MFGLQTEQAETKEWVSFSIEGHQNRCAVYPRMTSEPEKQFGGTNPGIKLLLVGLMDVLRNTTSNSCN